MIMLTSNYISNFCKSAIITSVCVISAAAMFCTVNLLSESKLKKENVVKECVKNVDNAVEKKKDVWSIQEMPIEDIPLVRGPKISGNAIADSVNHVINSEEDTEDFDDMDQDYYGDLEFEFQDFLELLGVNSAQGYNGRAPIYYGSNRRRNQRRGQRRNRSMRENGVSVNAQISDQGIDPRVNNEELEGSRAQNRRNQRRNDRRANRRNRNTRENGVSVNAQISDQGINPDSNHIESEESRTRHRRNNRSRRKRNRRRENTNNIINADNIESIGNNGE